MRIGPLNVVAALPPPPKHAHTTPPTPPPTPECHHQALSVVAETNPEWSVAQLVVLEARLLAGAESAQVKHAEVHVVTRRCEQATIRTPGDAVDCITMTLKVQQHVVWGGEG
mgnify:CR=1 FL=1